MTHSWYSPTAADSPARSSSIGQLITNNCKKKKNKTHRQRKKISPCRAQPRVRTISRTRHRALAKDTLGPSPRPIPAQQVSPHTRQRSHPGCDVRASTPWHRQLSDQAWSDHPSCTAKNRRGFWVILELLARAPS